MNSLFDNRIIAGSILWTSSIVVLTVHRRCHHNNLQSGSSSPSKQSESIAHLRDRAELPALSSLFLSLVLGTPIQASHGDNGNGCCPDGSIVSISVGNFIPSRDELSKFRSLCGSSNTTLSHLLPHVLGQRCLLTLLADPRSKKVIPFSLLGALHLRSYFEIIDNTRMGRFIDAEVSTAQTSNFAMTASLWGTSWSPNGKGTEIVLTLTLHESVGNSLFDIWRETLIWYSPNTLRDGEGPHSTAAQIIEKLNAACPDFKNLDRKDDSSVLNAFACKTSETTEFGWLSGDVNPIHMSTPMAWLFGQRSRIAHGAMVVAKALSYLEQEYPLSLSSIHQSFGVALKGPVPCGSSVTLQLPPPCDTGALGGVDLYSNMNTRPSICLRAFKSS